MGQSQPGSELFTKSVDVGNVVVEFAQANKASFTSAIAATDWRRLGILNGCQLDITGDKLDFLSGVPRTIRETIQIAKGLRVSGAAFEFRPIILAMALGLTQSDITTTLKSSSPTPTTVVTGSTKSSIILTDATGFEANRLIKVGSAYGYIKTLVGSTATLYEGLDLDTTPATGAAVSEVQTSAFNIGGLGSSRHVALKISKKIVGSDVDEWALYILDAQADPNISLSFPDGDAADKVSIPFAFDAIGNATVENGNLGQMVMTQN